MLHFSCHRTKELLQKLTDLQREPLTFTATEGYNPQRRFFISTDEIDNILRGGKGDTSGLTQEIPMDAQSKGASGRAWAAKTMVWTMRSLRIFWAAPQ